MPSLDKQGVSHRARTICLGGTQYVSFSVQQVKMRASHSPVKPILIILSCSIGVNVIFLRQAENRSALCHSLCSGSPQPYHKNLI